VITADGELQASQKLAQAAEVMTEHPAALQLRLLQTVVEVAADPQYPSEPRRAGLLAPGRARAVGAPRSLRRSSTVSQLDMRPDAWLRVNEIAAEWPAFIRKAPA
jgi:hypothetical protein